MKDFLGRELKIGDSVILTEPNYRNFVRAKVIAFTPQKVCVEYKVSWTTSPQTYLGESNFLVLIDDTAERWLKEIFAAEDDEDQERVAWAISSARNEVR